MKMTEIFDMNMNDLFGENSEFIEGFVGALEGIGIEIDAASLATILREYELAKMDFLQVHIMRMLESQGTIPDGPLKVVVSQSGIGFEPVDDEFDDFNFEPTDVTIVS